MVGSIGDHQAYARVDAYEWNEAEVWGEGFVAACYQREASSGPDECNGRSD